MSEKGASQRGGGPRHNRAYYDEFASWYEKERHRGYHAMLDDLEVDLLCDYARGGDVLEIGCGTGLILDRVREVSQRAVGVDISPGMLERAVERGLDVVQADATALPFADESFDVVYSFKVLAHIEQIEQALAEAARVTRPGGHMLLEFYNPLSVRYLAKRLGGPGKISQQTHESAVYTRWDHALRLPELLPAGVSVEDFAGVRIFTPAAFVHKLPLLSNVLRRAEFWGRDSALKYFGGFLIAIVRKR